MSTLKKLHIHKVLSYIIIATIVVFDVIAANYIVPRKIEVSMMEASAKQDELADEELSVDNFQIHPPRDLDGNEQRFKRITVEDDVIVFSQRMIGNAVVEKDQSVYIFDKASGQLKNKKISFRTSGPKLPRQLPSNLITKEKAESSVEGNSK